MPSLPPDRLEALLTHAQKIRRASLPLPSYMKTVALVNAGWRCWFCSCALGKPAGVLLASPHPDAAPARLVPLIPSAAGGRAFAASVAPACPSCAVEALHLDALEAIERSGRGCPSPAQVAARAAALAVALHHPLPTQKRSTESMAARHLGERWEHPRVGFVCAEWEDVVLVSALTSDRSQYAAAHLIALRSSGAKPLPHRRDVLALPLDRAAEILWPRIETGAIFHLFDLPPKADQPLITTAKRETAAGLTGTWRDGWRTLHAGVAGVRRGKAVAA